MINGFLRRPVLLLFSSKYACRAFISLLIKSVSFFVVTGEPSYIVAGVESKSFDQLPPDGRQSQQEGFMTRMRADT